MTKKQVAQLTEQQRVERAAKAKAERRARFLKLAPARVNRVLKALSSLANCANKQGYDFTPDEAGKVCTAISNAVQDCLDSFNAAAPKAQAFNL